jgi:transcription factor S
MLFCPECGSIMAPQDDGKKTLLACACGYQSVEREDILMKENLRNQKKVEIVDDVAKKAMPKTQAECPKCMHGEAFFWAQQTRASDEAETQFFECVKCQHRWRLYD